MTNIIDKKITSWGIALRKIKYPSFKANNYLWLRGAPTKKNLKSLIDLEFEVALVKFNRGAWVMIKGGNVGPQFNEGTVLLPSKFPNNFEIHLHTHHSKSPQCEFPSDNDLIMLNRYSGDFYILTHLGLTRYSKPVRDPLSHKPWWFAHEFDLVMNFGKYVEENFLKMFPGVAVTREALFAREHELTKAWLNEMGANPQLFPWDKLPEKNIFEFIKKIPL